MQIPNILKNIGFLIKNVPSASRKAEYHFNKAIETAKEIEANGYMAHAYLDLGLFHKAKNRKQQASRCISEAIKLFEQCGAVVYLKQANEALESLN
jgi:tetratricopeptide (TPR) repeat protein